MDTQVAILKVTKHLQHQIWKKTIVSFWGPAEPDRQVSLLVFRGVLFEAAKF